jgi:hypothetical protein
MDAAFRRKSARPRSRANVEQGEGARLPKNFRDWISRYVCNAAADSRGPASSRSLPRGLLAFECTFMSTASGGRSIAAEADLSNLCSSASRPAPFVVSVALGVLDVWDTERKRSTERTIATSKLALFWSFRFSERCYAPRPMSSLRQGSERAPTRVQRQRAAGARDPRPPPERARRRLYRAQISQGGSAVSD